MTYRQTVISCAVASVMALSGCSGKEARVQSYLTKGKEFYAAGQYDKARVELKNVLQIDPRNAESYFLIGRITEAQDNLPGAVTFYMQAADLDANQVDAKIRAARIYLIGGALVQAEKEINNALKVKPNDALALTVVAGIKARKQDFAGARETIQRALVQDPKLVDAVMLAASLYEQDKHSPEAIKILKQAADGGVKDISLRLVLAQIYANDKQYDQAVGILREVIRLEPKQTAHRVALAQLYIGIEKPDQAETVLREAITVLPDNLELKLAVIGLTYRAKGALQAEKDLLAFISKNPQDYDLRLALGELYQQNKGADKARSVYLETVQLAGTDAAGLKARNKLVRMAVEGNNVAEAEKLLAEVLTVNAKDQDALQMRAALSLAKNDIAAAISDYRAILKEEPKAVSVLKQLSRAHVLNRETPLAIDTLKNVAAIAPKDLEAAVQLASLLADNRQADEALTHVERVLKQDAKNVPALDILFKVQMAKNDFTAAQETVTKLKAAAPELPLPYYSAGLVYAAQNDSANAIKEFEAALQRQPQALEPLTRLVEVYLARNEADKALKYLDRYIKRNANDATVHSLRGQVLASQREIDLAQQAFKEALRIEPKTVTAYQGLAQLARVSNDSDKAIDIYSQGIKHIENSPVLMQGLAGVYEQRGAYEAAIQLYQRMVDLYPRSETAANNLAMALAAYRDDKPSLDKAFSLVDRLRNSTNVAYLDTLGWIHYRRGEYNTSAQLLERAVQKVQDSPLLHYHYGMALYKKGSVAAAKENLTKALAAETKFYGRDEAERTLHQLTSVASSE